MGPQTGQQARSIALVTNPLQTSKASQRMERLAAMENEMMEEEQAALELLKAQKDDLVTTFECVKVEFSDLDGMVWDRPQMSTSSSTSTIRPNGDENTPPLDYSEPIPASISLPTLPNSIRKANDDSTIRAAPNGWLRSRLISLPSKVDTSTMNIDDKIRDDLRAAYEKAAKKRSRSPVKALFAPTTLHGDVKSKPILSPRGRNSTPFPLHVMMETERFDSSRTGSPLWLSPLEGDEEGTIRPNVSGGQPARKGVHMIFGLGAITSPLADPGRR